MLSFRNHSGIIQESLEGFVIRFCNNEIEGTLYGIEMKKTLFVVFVLLAGLVSCRYDDSEIWEKVKENEARIAALEEQCRGLNQDLRTLSAIVTALQDNDYVTNVAEVKKDGNVVGYTISFSKSGAVTIYNGEDG